MAVSSTRKLTYEEWLTFHAEEGLRTELIDGEICVAPEPSARHQELVLRLAYAFKSYLDTHGGGKIYLPVNVRLGSDQGFAPDLVFVHEWGDDPVTYHGPPPLVIEVISDARRDLRIKRDRYELYGVPEYWAVWPEVGQIQVFRFDAGRYTAPAVHEPPGTVSPRALPELEIDLGRLFAED